MDVSLRLCEVVGFYYEVASDYLGTRKLDLVAIRYRPVLPRGGPSMDYGSI